MERPENIKGIIKILTEGELITLPVKQVEDWFEMAFKYIEQKEQYKKGVKLRDSKLRWQEQLLEKKKNKVN